MHWMPWAFSLDLISAGSSSAARIAMIAITTSSSINVNAEADILGASRAGLRWSRAEFISCKRSGYHIRRSDPGQSAPRPFPASDEAGQDCHSAPVPADAYTDLRRRRLIKLRKSDMCWPTLGYCRRSGGARIPIHAAPTELGRPCGIACYKHGAPDGASTELALGIAL